MVVFWVYCCMKERWVLDMCRFERFLSIMLIIKVCKFNRFFILLYMYFVDLIFVNLYWFNKFIYIIYIILYVV